MSIRAEKVASTLRKLIAGPISSFANQHNAGLATVTAVRLSPDLQIAKVYLSVYGGRLTAGEFITILEREGGYLRTIVGAGLRLRHTPQLKFFIDDTLDEIEHIQKLIDSARKTDADNEALSKENETAS